MINTSYFSNYIGDPNFYKNFSFLQFQRSATETHLKIHRMFREKVQPHLKIPLIYEIDDLLLGNEDGTDGIPEWNFAHQYYVKYQPFIRAMLSESNAIVTSTYSLRKEYLKYNNNIAVCLNHLPKYIWGDVEPRYLDYKKGDKVKILWAGSQNHFRHPKMVSAPDGGDFGDKLMNFIRKTVDEYDWNFMGALPIELEDLKDKIQFHPWVNTWEYPKYVKSIGADMAIAPLEQSRFNNCKSNIKSLEFAACGMPGVYSNADPYKFMNKTCNNDEQMITYIQELAGDVDLRAKVFHKDYSTIKPQLWWEEDDNLRKYINTYLGLMGRKLP